MYMYINTCVYIYTYIYQYIPTYTNKHPTGEIGAGPYEVHFRSGRAATTYEKMEENNFLEFFHSGHIDAPEYNISMKVCKYVFIYICIENQK
jgi:hypothetical protein